MGTKKPYVVKVRAKKSWTNVKTGRKYKKGKTYDVRLGTKSANIIKRTGWETPRYKIFSIRKKEKEVM